MNQIVAVVLAAGMVTGCAASANEPDESAVVSASGERASRDESTSSLPVVPATWPDRIVVGVAPGPSARVAEAIQQTSRWLSDGIGIEVGVSTLSGPEALAEAVIAGRIDVAVVDARAAQQLDGDVLFQVVRDERQTRDLIWVTNDADGCDDRQPLRTISSTVVDDTSVDEAELPTDESWMVCAELAGVLGDAVDGHHSDESGARTRDGIRPGMQYVGSLPTVGIAAHATSLSYAMTEAELRTFEGAPPELRAFRTTREALAALAAGDVAATAIDLGWIRHRRLGPVASSSSEQVFTIVAIGPSVPTELVVASNRIPVSLRRVVANTLDDMANSPQGAAAWLDLADIEGFADYDAGGIDESLRDAGTASSPDRIALAS